MWYVGVLCLFGLAAFDRFYRLDIIGMNGSDVFFYFETAKEYLAGHFIATEHFRPLAYGVYALALKVGGVNLYSIKYLNCGLDMLNVLMVLVIGLRVLPNRWWALIPPLLYVLLAETFVQARSELLHVPSTLPFLAANFLMLFSFQHWSKPVSYAYLLAAGVCLGMAANLHPTMGMAMPLMLVSIVGFIYLRTNTIDELRTILRRSSVFLVGFFAVYLTAAAFVGLREAQTSFFGNRNAQSGGDASLFDNLAFNFTHFVSDNSSATFAALTILLTLVGTRFVRRRNFFFSMVLVEAVGYMILYAILVPKFRLSRTFLPFIPLVMIFITRAAYDSLQALSPSARRYALPLAGLALVVVVLSLRPTLDSWRPSVVQPVAIYYEIYQRLAPAMGPSDSVVVLPLVAYADRQPLAQPAYFGPRANYAISHPAATTDDLLNTRWVVLQKDELDLRLLENSQREIEKRLWNYLQTKPENYDPLNEQASWKSRLVAHGFTSTFANERYEIFKRSLP